jgi:hypothetical protein
MPVLLGFILGVAITILGVYEYDSTTGRAGNGLSASAAGGKAPMVNWDVVNDDWHNLQNSVRSTTDSLERKLKPANALPAHSAAAKNTGPERSRLGLGGIPSLYSHNLIPRLAITARASRCGSRSKVVRPNSMTRSAIASRTASE